MFNLGILFVFAYNLITSVKGVYVSSLMQHIDPFATLAVTFSIVSAIFLLSGAIRGSLRKTLQIIKAQRQNALMLCGSTLGGWLSFYLALKSIEPAVVMAITSASGPIITRMLFPGDARAQEANAKSIRADGIFSVLIFLTMIYLVWQTLLGQSSIGKIQLSTAVLGFAAAMICGAANVFNTIFSKRLNARGLGSMQILSFRFLPLVLLAIPVAYARDGLQTLQVNDFEKLALIGILGISLPIFLFQEGIRRSTPMVVAFVHATIPIFVLLIQFFDPRLSVTVYSIGGVITISLLSLISLLTRSSFFAPQATRDPQAHK